MNENLSGFEATAEDGAVNVYQNDMADEFPVLKAFQQYIDAEQAKARKRMLLLSTFFGFVLTIVIAVFVFLLVASNYRNQTLNDRLVEYAMKDRDQAPPTSLKDDPALQVLMEKIETLQKDIAEDRERVKKAAEEAEKEKRPTVEALEIERLKALLAAEKEKAAAEREKQRQAELEEYRRKNYPELYEQKPAKTPSAPASSASRKNDLSEEEAAADREIEAIINDIKAIDYFGDEEADESKKSSKNNAVPSEDDVEIPNEIKDSSGNTWSIPKD